MLAFEAHVVSTPPKVSLLVSCPLNQSQQRGHEPEPSVHRGCEFSFAADQFSNLPSAFQQVGTAGTSWVEGRLQNNIYIYMYMYISICFFREYTWTPKVCKIIGLWAMYSGFGPLFYILWGSRCDDIRGRIPDEGRLFLSRSGYLKIVLSFFRLLAQESGAQPSFWTPR